MNKNVKWGYEEKGLDQRINSHDKYAKYEINDWILEKLNLKPGERVWGSNQGLLGRQGTFAEFAAVEERWLYATPDEVSDMDAAALALTGITAHLGCFRLANLKMGENVFGLRNDGKDIEAAARAGIEAMKSWLGSVGRLLKFRDLGIDDSKFETMADDAVRLHMQSQPYLINPRPIDRAGVIEIFRKAL